MCIKANQNDPTYDEIHGYYTPEMKINVDQSHLPFVIDQNQSYEKHVLDTAYYAYIEHCVEVVYTSRPHHESQTGWKEI